MSHLWIEIASWWLRLAFAGGLLLLAGLCLFMVYRQPINRLRVGAWTLFSALLLLPLTLLPGWMTLPWQLPIPTSAARTIEPAPPVSKPVESARTAVESVRPADVLNRYYFTLEQTAVPVMTEKAPVTADVQAMPTPRSDLLARADIQADAQNQSNNSGQQKSSTFLSAWIFNSLLLGYVAIVVALIGRLLIGQWHLERLWRSGRQGSLDVRRIFRSMIRRFQRQPALRVSERVTGPICFGFLRPRILIPAALAEVADERTLRWIFSHEMSHLERRDPLVGWFIGLSQALFFFWPWFWKLRREIRLNQEYLADNAAVRMSVKVEPIVPLTPAADYADFLVHLSSTGSIPIGAAGVKSPSSDLYRRVAMLLQKTDHVKSTCPRRWSFVAGGALLALGCALAGFNLSTREAVAAPAEPKAEPTKKEAAVDPEKKEAIEVDEDAVRKALESLKKGAEPKKEDKEVDRNPIDEMSRAEEALKKAQKDLQENPKSEDARKAFAEAVKRYQAATRNRQPQFNRIPFPANDPNIQIAPLDPAEFYKDAQRMQEQMRKHMEEMQKQFQMQPGFFPGGPNRVNFNMMRFGNPRLGIRLEKPSAVLAEQLDLPANQGMIVNEVMPDSAAAKAGIKANDIILEIGGKAVPSDLMELQNVLKDVKAGQKVDVVLMRKGKKETLKNVEIPEAKFGPPNGFPQFPNFQPLQPGDLPRLKIQVPNLKPMFTPEAFSDEANATSMSVEVNNDDFTIKFQENGMKVTVTGAKQDGKKKTSSIEINDNGKVIKADTIDKLDEKYKTIVQKLLDRVG